jgi:flavin reductase (DIM6/NTAB) family NADH-FMN oxidoreductase RutF
MQTFDLKSLPTEEVYQLMIGAIAPRPIAFVSTLDASGVPNLAPYSYFNAVSSNPPVIIFSASIRAKNLTVKDTLNNLYANGELVVNMVNYSIVRQMAIASIEFPAGVSEFEKSGLTPLPSDLVKPFRVKESPVQLECKVQQIIPFGNNGGAGNLVICDVLCMHIDENVLDEHQKINPHKIDLMGRMGRAYYVRASGEAIYTIYQNQGRISIGYDQLPLSAKQSRILTGNDLGQLAGIYSIPTVEELTAFKTLPEIQRLLQLKDLTSALHQFAQKELAKENLENAAQAVWLADLL